MRAVHAQRERRVRVRAARACSRSAADTGAAACRSTTAGANSGRLRCARAAASSVIALAQEIAQHRVDESFRGRVCPSASARAPRDRRSHAAPRACGSSWIEGNAQKLAQRVRPRAADRAALEHRIDLAQEAQRSEGDVLKRRALAVPSTRFERVHIARSSASRLRPASTRPTTRAACRCTSSISAVFTRRSAPRRERAAGEKGGGGERALPPARCSSRSFTRVPPPAATVIAPPDRAATRFPAAALTPAPIARAPDLQRRSAEPWSTRRASD